MDIRKIIALAAAAVCAAAQTSCGRSKSSAKAEPPVPIIEAEASSEADTTEPIEVETFPDYPVEVPEIKKQSAEDFYEAEDAELAEGLSVAAVKENFSGKGYVTGFSPDGKRSLTFKLNVPTNQHYDLSFNIASDKASTCKLLLNGETLTEFSANAGGKFTQITIRGLFLTKGASELTVVPKSSSLCLDYLKLSDNKSLGEISYDADGRPVNENAGEAAKELLSFLTDSYGKFVITGQYAADSDDSELDLIYRTTGKYPVIRFCNLSVPKGSYDESFRDVDACASWYRKGGIVCASWYWNAPSEKSSIRTNETDFSLAKAVTDKDIALLDQEEIRGLCGEGDVPMECYALIRDIDVIAGQLLSLQSKGVPVLWRPLPEGGGSWYWWGASGAEAYKWLWDLIYRRLTEYFGLDNLVWVWNGQSASSVVDKSTYDIAAVDIYMNGKKDYGASFYESFAAVQKFAGKGKLIAISECGSVPDIDAAFRDNALFSFFGLWFGEYVEDEEGNYSEEHTSREALVRTYNSEGALTLDEYERIRGGEELDVTTETVSDPPEATTAGDAPGQ